MFDIHKLGGAALQDPQIIQSIPSLIAEKVDKPLILVVSAMGNVTRQLESLFQQYLHQQDYTATLDQLYAFHESIIIALFGDQQDPLLLTLGTWRDTLQQELAKPCAPNDVAARYSQLIAWGEILSSTLVHRYFLHIGIPFVWLDARNYIKTKQGFMDANLDEDQTYTLLQEGLWPLLKQNQKIIIQGFIASDGVGRTTTLGKEGSDFTAAILAAGLGATSLTIWKDVPGIMNSDPRWANNPLSFEELHYKTMASMSYYGAQVIHPKTIGPLAQHNISLYVRSFKDKNSKGTHIHGQATQLLPHPIYILKQEQLFIILTKKDLRFLEENCLTTIFDSLHRFQLQANFVDRTPYSLLLALNNDGIKTRDWMDLITPAFQVGTYPHASLLTILDKEPTMANIPNTLTLGKKILAQKYNQENLQLVFCS